MRNLIFKIIVCCHVLIAINYNATCKSTTKPYTFIASVGKGYPSLLAYIAVKNANQQLEIVKCTNPTMAKLEYARKRWGVALTFTTNQQEFNLLWANTNPQLKSNFKIDTWDVGLRGNYYLVNRTMNHKIAKLKLQDCFQLYIGGGAGYLSTKQSTKFTGGGFNDPPIDTYTYGKFPMSFEATLGSRYFVAKHFGIFVEIGLGNSPIQLIDKGASDSYIQTGFSFKL